MQGLLAATIAVVAGCSFTPPDPADPGNAPEPGVDGGTSDPDAPPGDAPPAARCSTYEYDYNGHRYRLTMNGEDVRSVSWMAGKADCESDGGYLMKIDASNEDQQVENVLWLGPQEVWIGLHDPDQQGSYLWTDGTAPSFTHWSSAPSAGSPDCVSKNTRFNDGRWYTRDCADNRPAICECNP